MQVGRAQRQVLESLARGLSPRDYALHLRSCPGGDELIVCHRQRGVLALKILSGDVELDARTRQWWRVDLDSEQAIRDPMREAQAAAWRLGEELRRERVLAPPGYAVAPVVGHALVLPDSPRRPWPASWPAELVIDRHRLERPRDAMEAAFLFLHRRSPLAAPLSLASWRRLNAVLSPDAARALDAGAVLAQDRPEWVELGDFQLRALRMMTALDRVAVRGAGGTGKTLVALAATRSLANEGERVLLTCHNRLVGDLLAESLERSDGVLALSFHQLCRLLLVEEGVEPPAPHGDEDPARFWREYLPRLAFEHTGAYERRFDVVVVDEAHRFESGWWPLLERLLRPEGRMLGLYDPNLDARHSAQSATEGWPEVVLPVNRRSTAALHRAARRAVGERLTGEDEPVRGEPPEVRGYSGCVGLVRQLADELVRVRRTEAVPAQSVVILSPQPVSASCLADVTTLGDFGLVERRTTRVDEIRFSNISSFAGLEAEVVLLVDIDPEHGVGLHEDLYLALTRARRRVVIWVREQHVERMRALVSPGGTEGP